LSLTCAVYNHILETTTGTSEQQRCCHTSYVMFNYRSRIDIDFYYLFPFFLYKIKWCSTRENKCNRPRFHLRAAGKTETKPHGEQTFNFISIFHWCL